MSYQQHIQNAKALIYGDSSLQAAGVIFRRVKKEAGEVYKDKSLSNTGIIQKQNEIRKQGAVEVAKIIQAAKSEVGKELDAAEKSARAAIDQTAAKPADEVIRDFTERYDTLKTELLVFSDRSSAGQMLDLMRETGDPYLARLILDDFAAIGPALNGHVTDGMTVRAAYDGLKRIAETDSRAQAREALETIERLRNTPPVNSMITLGLTSALGDRYQNILYDYETLLDEAGA
ncbi:hypothetical protein J1TS5_61580 [Paenibacillus macerans]|uniref:hypothetical protein n=1 Tax=Paenibacillus macerans TaxID=44252 RepID=UPI001B1B99DA|nr:hypothetical protein [Paenibacillus macerans]GIP13988.1 hypothetical protein J1TS5_61580 [Paenibacillus macerans]